MAFLEDNQYISARALTSAERQPNSDEIEEAIRWCAENELIMIRGETWEGLFCARLTNLGRDALASGYGPEDYVATSNFPLTAYVNYDYSQHQIGQVINTNGNGNAIGTGSGNALSTSD